MADRDSTDKTMTFRWSDAVITIFGTLACSYLVARGRWVPGWKASAVTYGIIAVGPPFFRWLAWKYPRYGLFDLIASIWILPAVIWGHMHLSPLVDALNPRLYDAWLALADFRLFGSQPALELSRAVPPPLMDALMLCYYSYFTLPVAVGMWLYFKERRAIFEEFSLALSLLYALNFVLYILVPAVGPRFFLGPLLSGPLPGEWITPFLDSLLRRADFNRDCFPSGHTGVTLVVLFYAFRYARPLFRFLLPVGTGLIVATVAGRFHYVIDLMCAVPLAIACASAASYLLHRAEAFHVQYLGVPVRAPAKI